MNNSHLASVIYCVASCQTELVERRRRGAVVKKSRTQMLLHGQLQAPRICDHARTTAAEASPIRFILSRCPRNDRKIRISRFLSIVMVIDTHKLCTAYYVRYATIFRSRNSSFAKDYGNCDDNKPNRDDVLHGRHCAGDDVA